MFDDSRLSTTVARSTSGAAGRARQESKSTPTLDELFYGIATRQHALDSTGVARCSRLTLIALIAAAILSAALTLYIAVRGLPPEKQTPAPPSTSDASHARFSPL